MNLALSLREDLQQALQAVFGADVPLDQLHLQTTRKEFAGQYTFVTFPYSRVSRLNPEQTGQKLGEHLRMHSPRVADFNVVKGFLNLELAESIWLQLLGTMVADAAWGQHPATGQKVMVEYSSPNTNKPLHLGHLRNNFLGYAVATILRAAGDEVVKANLVNDRGIHICKSMIAYEQFGHGETPEAAGLKGDHLIGKYYVRFDQEYKREQAELVAQGLSAEAAEKQAPLLRGAQDLLRRWEAGDEAVRNLWAQLNGWVYEGFATTYRRMGVDFDQYYYESDTYLLGKEIVEEGLAKGVFFRKEDGSVWIDLTAEGLDEKLLLRPDGTSVYMTQDMGTADLKYRDHAVDRSLYVVGNEQDYHFQVLFAILRRLGRPYAEGLFHLSYGMVDLPSGKMKSREGTVVDADDLMAEMVETAARRTAELGKLEDLDNDEARALYEMLALGALKFFLLRVDPKKRMLFNPEESIDFQGHTGPFVQYTHARIAAILRRAEQLAIAPDLPTRTALHPAERDLIVLLADYPGKVQDAARQYAPSLIAQYAYDLAREYNRFYAELSIFNDPEPEATLLRVHLSRLTGRTIRHALGLLGIQCPERM